MDQKSSAITMAVIICSGGAERNGVDEIETAM
jgi:hypothetical protein